MRRPLSASSRRELQILPILLVVVVWLPINAYLVNEKKICDAASHCAERIEREVTSLPPMHPSRERTYQEILDDTARYARYEGNDKCVSTKTGEVYYRNHGKEVMDELAEVNEAYRFLQDLECLNNKEKASFKPEIRRYWALLDKHFEHYQ